jgi:hypothetical protein
VVTRGARAALLELRHDLTISAARFRDELAAAAGRRRSTQRVASPA